MFIFSFSKNNCAIYPFTTIIPFISLEIENILLLSFQIFAEKPECRDLLVAHDLPSDQKSILLSEYRSKNLTFNF